MPDQKHTPGPWLRIDKADYAEIHAAFRPSSQAVALVAKAADADLIAAAPCTFDAASRLLAVFDELQAVTTAERIITGQSQRDLRQRSNEAIADLRAAIAKATGQ
jgi:hypothetical protein